MVGFIMYITLCIQLFLIVFIINSKELQKEEKRRIIGTSSFIDLALALEYITTIFNVIDCNLIVFLKTIELIAPLIAIVLCITMIKMEDMLQGRNIYILIEMFVSTIFTIIIQAAIKETKISGLIIAIVFLKFTLYYEKLKHEKDSLTSVLTRAVYESALENLDYETFILIIDLNDFKQINDNYGHQVGDIILQEAGKVLKNTYKKIGYCYRIGGDEFAVILKRGEKQKLAREIENYDDSKGLECLKNSLLEQVKEEQKSEPIFPDIAVGGATYIPGKKAVKEVIKASDYDMYKEKAKMKQ